MKKNKKPNIIWIVVDAVRNYPASDKYGKLKLMQKFALESVEFTKVVSSAVSSSMSIGGMISSRLAYYINRDYEIFEYDKNIFPPLTDILESNGYNNYTIHHYPHTRRKMGKILYSVPQKYWPKGLSKHKLWNEVEMNSVFLKLIKKGLKEPFFLFMHYDVPTSNNFTSKKVGLILRKLKEENLYDNSIIILCSDHGFPDPTRTAISLKQKVMEGHDLLITDDNIMMPLIIKYPGCPKNHKIPNIVSSLDITPTILSILKIPYKKYGLEGLNLLKIINGEKTPQRKIRTDSRYCFQPIRTTSLRNDKYKYTLFLKKPLEKREGFFDIESDKLEQRNLIYSKDKKIIDKIKEFKKELELSEEKATNLQRKYLRKKFKILLNNTNIQKARRILIFGTADILFVDILLNNIFKSSRDTSVDVIIKKNFAKKIKTKSKKLNFIFSNLTYKDLKKRLKVIRRTKYNLIIIPLANHLGIGYNPIFKFAKRSKAGKVINVDYNLTLVKESNMWAMILKDLRKDLITKLLDWKNFAGNLVLLAKRIIFDKYF